MAALCDWKFKFSPFHCFVCCLLQIARCLSFVVFRAFCRAASRLVLCSPVFNLVISLAFTLIESLAFSLVFQPAIRLVCNLVFSRLQSRPQSCLQSVSAIVSSALSWIPKLWRCWHSIVKWNRGNLCRMARNARYGTCKRVIREAQSKQKWKQMVLQPPNEPAIWTEDAHLK